LPDFTIEPIESSPFAQVAYLIWRHGNAEGLVIDPGFETRKILQRVERNGLRLAAILNTHGHLDHIAGNEAMKAAFPQALLLIGRNEAALLGNPAANMSASFGQPLISPAADRLVSDGQLIELAGFKFEVREIPGHSPGSVVFLCKQYDPHFVFGGDVLFAGSVGRTDVGGDFDQLAAGIRAKLFTLDDSTVVYPGHGPPTTIGAEKQFNPFVGLNQ
jgi:glyoxylase-like metal-dependent hydrolase (beta-lactamase superfamily II)